MLSQLRETKQKKKGKPRGGMFIQTSQVSNKRRDFPVCQASHHLNVHVCLLYKLHLYLCTWQDKTPEFGQKIQAPPPSPPLTPVPHVGSNHRANECPNRIPEHIIYLVPHGGALRLFFSFFFFWFPLLKVRSLLWSIISLSGSIPQALFFLTELIAKLRLLSDGSDWPS